MGTLLLLLLLLAIGGAEWYVIRNSRWYKLEKHLQMEQLPRITITINWSGSGYQYAPPRITLVSKDGWEQDAARIILDTLKKMEASDTNTVEVVPAPASPELVGKVVVNKTNEYQYTVVGTEVTNI